MERFGIKMRPSGIGGMAVIEGVMMKNKEEYAVAVRKPNNEITVEMKQHKDFSDKVKLFKLPIFRGILAFVDSMVIGVKVINFSAGFFEEEEQGKADKKDKSYDRNSKKNSGSKQKTIEELSVTDIDSASEFNYKLKEVKNESKEKKENDNAFMMIAAVLLSIVFSVAFFMVLPVLVSNLFVRVTDNQTIISLIEGLLRLAVFIGYVSAVSHMKEIKRVFMYHGAEHKTINCLENGFELTLDNVKWQSKQHKRCGTSFMLLVMLISLVFFIFLPAYNLLWRVVSRIILVPIIAGLSYEVIRFAGKNENKLVEIISLPGLWMQGLTTKEPDDQMIEVAIASVEAVFDWRSFLAISPSEEEVIEKEVTESKNKSKIAASVARSEKTIDSDEEDDDILKALDRYLVVDDAAVGNSKRNSR